MMRNPLAHFIIIGLCGSDPRHALHGLIVCNRLRERVAAFATARAAQNQLNAHAVLEFGAVGESHQAIKTDGTVVFDRLVVFIKQVVDA